MACRSFGSERLLGFFGSVIAWLVVLRLGWRIRVALVFFHAFDVP